MRIIGRKIIVKYKKKNNGNSKLIKAIDVLITEIENWNPQQKTIYELRKDADCVHTDGFYFFNVELHRSLILIEIDENEVTIVWIGNHQEYERVFKNNKTTIEKWLRIKNYIE
jgi:mRNA-degrading endonuclease HigB of HigAB toxin-antitoxin module